MKQLKILHIISSIDPKGGGPIEGIKQRGIFLKNQGHCIEVLSMDDPQSEHAKTFPLKAHLIGPSWGTFGFNTHIKKWLKQNARNYDHILIHGLWQYHGHAAASTLKSIKIPYYVFTHGMLDPWFKETYPLKHLKKTFYWLLSEYWTLKNAAKVFFTSEEEKLRARQSFKLYSANETVVPYGTASPPTDKDHFRKIFLAQHPSLADKELLLYLSRIHPKKGCDLLIEAFAEIAQQRPKAHLLMAGPGDENTLQQLKKQAHQCNLDERITWLGMVKGEAKWAAFHAAQVFVLPSHQENFGIAVAEALGCGLPVLISDKINIWREIQSDQAGIVNADTVHGTQASLRSWFSLSRENQCTMAKKAYESFKNRFTVDAMAFGLLQELQNSSRNVTK